jgi:hypothetical protein
MLPVRGEAFSAFTVKMENSILFADYQLPSSIYDFKFMNSQSGPNVLTAHRPFI